MTSGSSSMNTLTLLKDLSETRSVRSSSSAPTPSKNPSRGISLETPCNQSKDLGTVSTNARLESCCKTLTHPLVDHMRPVLSKLLTNLSGDDKSLQFLSTTYSTTIPTCRTFVSTMY